MFICGTHNIKDTQRESIKEIKRKFLHKMDNINNSDIVGSSFSSTDFSNHLGLFRCCISIKYLLLDKKRLRKRNPPVRGQYER